MFRKICNYMAVLSLSLAVTGSALANPTTDPKSPAKEVVVDVVKGGVFFTEIMTAGAKHAYTVKVEPGKQVRIKVRSDNKAALKVQIPGGESKTYGTDKFFDVKLLAEGEYVIEVSSLFISQYSIDIFNQ